MSKSNVDFEARFVGVVSEVDCQQNIIRVDVLDDEGDVINDVLVPVSELIAQTSVKQFEDCESKQEHWHVEVKIKFETI